ncbi:hypothetical protein DICPUDRAFT_153446 [Dictyostelium purpureum]|uniref:Methyltransferase type 11 domain-containing protein n=1 Tax=Dictyostelium purpureum TaxID=5786 RepID=F0ZNX7_DICPU|nr:uncharacterized protein DICPUDRAFT_153446 [Dictyostelium purpureum]EGC34342.1 hypothetical protein DICPUDRAFT_153446 [Dictyostelium purpureum]|eukprot:XP_003289135.1 hypothetical protein DICPUDRAFT_153446 [Dictyostelium purpureum]
MSENKRKFYFKKGKDYGQQHKKNKKDSNKEKENIVLEKVNCPLCENDRKEEIIEFSRRMNKLYYTCKQCGLVYLHPHYHVDNQKEKTRYEFHQNSPQDEKYKSFLQPCVDKLIPLLREHNKDQKDNEIIGLDYGCGPGPTLSLMFKEKGFTLENYDPYFLENDKVKQAEKYLENSGNQDNNSDKIAQPFHFVTCTEAIEHFKAPILDLKKIIDGGLISKNNGLLLIMTQLLLTDEQFENWHYPRDYTHICFFRPTTFNWISKKFNSNLLEMDEKRGIIILSFKNNENKQNDEIDKKNSENNENYEK